jgi:hypothetical protein
MLLFIDDEKNDAKNLMQKNVVVLDIGTCEKKCCQFMLYYRGVKASFQPRVNTVNTPNRWQCQMRDDVSTECQIGKENFSKAK